MSRWPISWYDDLAEKIDRKWGWDKLPLPLAMLDLIGLRNRLREKNLYDTGRGPLDRPDVDDAPALPDRAHARRHAQRPRRPADGQPRQPLRPQRPARVHGPRAGGPLLEPNPRRVSRELLTRDEFIPATTLNLLAGAWIQFEVHDWFSHGKNEPENPWVIAARRRRPVARAPDGDPAHAPRPERDADGPADVRHRRHALVGRLADLRPRPGVRPRAALRRARQAADRRARPAAAGPRGARRPHAASPGNFWVGLALLHSLFMREHNAVCDHLHDAHPELSDDELYDKARLVVAALMAKIHTIDWTPAIIAHPTTVHGAAHELVGPRGRAARQAARPAHVERGASAASPARRPTTTASRTR